MLPFQVFHPMLGDGQMSNSTTFQATKLKGKKVRGENGDRLMHNLSRKGRFWGLENHKDSWDDVQLEFNWFDPDKIFIDIFRVVATCD